MVVSLSPAWAAFGRLQQSIENERFAVADAFADEAALIDLLDEFQSDQLLPEEVGRRFHSLRKNRRRKYRCRRRLLASVVERSAFEPRANEKPAEKVDNADEVEWVKRRVSEREWTMFLRLADGEESERLAADAGTSVGAFRVRLFRLRRCLQAVA